MGGAANRQRFEQMQRTNRDRVQGWIDEGEKLVNSGMAQSVDIAERVGRGGGEGILVLTDRRLLFQLDEMVPGFGGMSIPRDEITHVHHKWIIAPQMRQLFVSTNRDGSVTTMSFYVGKTFARELESQLMR